MGQDSSTEEPEMEINKPLKQFDDEVKKYKFNRIGIIKDVDFGLLVGNRMGAFAVLHDGGFGMSLSIVDTDGFPINYQMRSEECEKFFKDMGVIWHM